MVYAKMVNRYIQIDITEQIIEESLINSCLQRFSLKEGGGGGGGGEGISELSVGAICNVFLVSYTL